MANNQIKIPKKAVAERDWKNSVAVEGKDNEPALIMPEKGDIVDFRCKGIVVSAEGDSVVVEVRHVNDSRVEDETPSAEKEESDILDKAKKSDGDEEDDAEKE